MSIQRRDVLKWSTPVVASVLLPTHAQGSEPPPPLCEKPEVSRHIELMKTEGTTKTYKVVIESNVTAEVMVVDNYFEDPLDLGEGMRFEYGVEVGCGDTYRGTIVATHECGEVQRMISIAGSDCPGKPSTSSTGSSGSSGSSSGSTGGSSGTASSGSSGGSSGSGGKDPKKP